MDTRKIQPSEIDSQTLQKLEQEMHGEIIKSLSLNKGSVKEILARYGIPGKQHIHLYFKLDLQAGDTSQISVTAAAPLNCICYDETIEDWVRCPCPT